MTRFLISKISTKICNSIKRIKPSKTNVMLCRMRPLISFQCDKLTEIYSSLNYTTAVVNFEFTIFPLYYNNEIVKIISLTRSEINLIYCSICNYRSTRMSEILKAFEEGNIHEVKRLLQADGDINAKYRTGDKCSILHNAAKSGSLEIIKYLFEHGADVNYKKKGGESVLHYAAKFGSLEIVKYLVEHGADVNCKNKRNKSVLHNAAKSGSLEIVKYLVEHGADVNNKNEKNKSVLHNAAKSGSLEMVKYLVEYGADVTCETKWENISVLHHAAESDSLEIVKYLVEHGADVNNKDKGGGSVLHNAAKSGSLQIVKYLVEHGADVNCQTNWYFVSVLHSAARSGSLEIVKYLVEHGADVNCTNKRNASVLDNAVHCGSLEMVKYLVEQGADVNIGNETIVDYLFRLGKMKDIHDCDGSGRSLLSIACYGGNTAFVQTLLKYKVDVRKERELVCGNEETANMMNLELKKSIKHRKKIEDLSVLGDVKLHKVYITFYVSHACFKLCLS